MILLSRWQFLERIVSMQNIEQIEVSEVEISEVEVREEFLNLCITDSNGDIR